jgi:hypothetical protein
MRKKITFLILVFNVLSIKAQVKLDDFGRIILNSYLPDKIQLPIEARNQLITKLNQITSKNGMSGSMANPRFILSANVNVGTKDIISGPPQMLAQNLDLVLFIGDAITNTIFASTNIYLKGVGGNENKAFIEAFKGINVNSKEIALLLEEGKNKIISYYQTRCDFIIKEAQAQVKQGRYDQAIYELSIVPDVCEDCYFRCIDTLTHIYQQKIDADCKIKFNEAKVIWTSSQTLNGAEKAGDILITIDPLATCSTDVEAFIKSIEAKIKTDEKARWQFKMKQYEDKIAAQKESVRIAEEKSKRDDVFRENQAKRDDNNRENQSKRNFELDKIRTKAYKEIAIEYAKRILSEDVGRNINWR